MKIQLASKNLIPMISKTGNGQIVFDLMLHGLLITNTGKHEKTIKKISLSLIKGKQEIETRIIHDTQLKKEVKALRKNLLSNIPEFIGIKFSKKLPKSLNLVNTLKIKNTESIITAHEYFHLRNTIIPTKIEIKVLFQEGNKKKEEKQYFQLRTHICKNKYIFPLKGKIVCLAGPGCGDGHHRSVTSQEFAYDFVSLNKECDMTMGKGNANSKFHAFGDSVIAPASGRIIFAKDGIKDNNKLGDVPPITLDKIKKWGLDHVFPGNIVIIKHANDEYSLMAHLKKGSIKVKKGQRVKKGEVVGELGNTGNSTAPHLHYHLMDADNMFWGRSIPIKFENIRIIGMKDLEASHPNEEFNNNINVLIDPIVKTV